MQTRWETNTWHGKDDKKIVGSHGASKKIGNSLLETCLENK